jgi:hypothetical protein
MLMFWFHDVEIIIHPDMGIMKVHSDIHYQETSRWIAIVESCYQVKTSGNRLKDLVLSDL